MDKPGVKQLKRLKKVNNEIQGEPEDGLKSFCGWITGSLEFFNSLDFYLNFNMNSSDCNT